MPSLESPVGHGFTLVTIVDGAARMDSEQAPGQGRGRQVPQEALQGHSAAADTSFKVKRLKFLLPRF